MEFQNFINNLENKAIKANTTAQGNLIISQNERNQLRKIALENLLKDLTAIYDPIELVETKDGLIIVVENEPTGKTISLELKLTIKSLDFDPFQAGINYDDARAEKERKATLREQQKLEREANLEARRAEKLQSLQPK